MLVDGVTKLDKLKYGDSAQAETVRKMIVAMSKDIRVLIIKLADRLHNARTWGFVPQESATRKAQETLEIYAPLAHRLGIQTIKWELEDLSFAVLYPKLYVEIESLVRERTPQREEFVQQVIDAVNEDLKAAKIKGQVVGRPKQYYSIYQKMIAARPRVRRDLRPRRHPGARQLRPRLLRGARLDPRPLEPDPRPVQGLHRDAEVQPLPVAAHDGDRAEGPRRRDPDPHPRDAPARRVRRRRALEVQGADRIGGQGDGRASSRTTPTWPGSRTSATGRPRPPTRGSSSTTCASRSARRRSTSSRRRARSSACPPGATPVDFAYAVHTEVGHRTMGAKVNGRLVPLESALVSRRRRRGVHLEEPGCRPEPGLAQLRQEPARAQQDPRLVHEGAPRRGDRAGQGRDRPRDAQAEPAAAEADEPGRRRRGRGADAVRRASRRSTRRSARATSRPSRCIEKVARVAADRVAEADEAELPFIPKGRSRALRPSDSGVLVRGAPDILVKLAKCCTPVPGDEIVGFVTRGAGRLGAPGDCNNVVDPAATSPSG